MFGTLLWLYHKSYPSSAFIIHPLDYCVLLLALGGYPASLSCLFDFEMVHIYTKKQQLVLIAHLLNSLCLAITLWYVVQRAKQCWDFTCTLHFFHLIICCVYIGKFPGSLTWWLTQLVCIILIVVISEYLCFKSDMKDIPLVGSNKADVWVIWITPDQI